MKTAGQRRAIHHFVSGRDVFVSLPTGYGVIGNLASPVYGTPTQYNLGISEPPSKIR